MRTKKYIEFINEISGDLLNRASRKALEHGQKRLSNRFLNHFSHTTDTIANDFLYEPQNDSLELRVLFSYTYDIYIDTYNLENYDIPYNKITKTKIVEYDYIDDEFIFYYNHDIEYDSDLSMLDQINIKNISNKLVISLSDNINNKFSNRKSVMKFIQMMNKLYTLHNPNINNNALSKINGVELNHDEGDGFYKFVNDNFGSWEEFRKKINVRKLYDTYK